LYPSYDKVLEAKKLCYPPENSITVTETKAEIKLQALLDHTATRIAEVSKERLDECLLQCNGKLTLISKWGCDGSGNHALYKQKVIESDELLVDSNVVMTCLVPLQLYADTTDVRKTEEKRVKRHFYTNFVGLVNCDFTDVSCLKLDSIIINI